MGALSQAYNIYNKPAYTSDLDAWYDEFHARLRIKTEDEKTADEVLRLVDRLQLPAPKNQHEFLYGNEAIIIFSNIYSVTLRIFVPAEETYMDDNPWVLPAIGRFQAGRAYLEICPGARGTNNPDYVAVLSRNLADTGVELWDNYTGTSNIGLWPIATPQFPEGIPVVIDKGAVRALSTVTPDLQKSIAEAYDRMGIRREDFEGFLKPLKDALSAAVADDFEPQKMRAFWRLCEAFANDGKLVAGWQQDRDNPYKLQEVRSAAEKFDRRVNWYRTPGAPA